MTTRRHCIATSVALACAFAAGSVAAQANRPPFKIGFILPMTGPFASTGKQIEAAVKLWMAQNGSTVAGRKVELLLKDDAGTPTRRGASPRRWWSTRRSRARRLRPDAAGAGDRADRDAEQDADGGDRRRDVDHHRAVALHRAHQLHAAAGVGGDRRVGSEEQIKKVVTFVADYGPGLDAEKFFKSQFRLNGGEITGEIRSPLRSPDFAPFLQRVADLKPDAVFAFLPSGQGTAFMKQFASAASTRPASGSSPPAT
jgi:branched-chain amino acid transport system substrate-binding protein